MQTIGVKPTECRKSETSGAPLRHWRYHLCRSSGIPNQPNRAMSLLNERLPDRQCMTCFHPDMHLAAGLDAF
jgi:hypothetical protein